MLVHFGRKSRKEGIYAGSFWKEIQKRGDICWFILEGNPKKRGYMLIHFGRKSKKEGIYADSFCYAAETSTTSLKKYFLNVQYI